MPGGFLVWISLAGGSPTGPFGSGSASRRRAPHFPSRVLLVIDDVTIGAILARDLIAQGYEVS
jgi:hypothetical protein